MKLIKALYKGEPRWAVLENGKAELLAGTPYDGTKKSGEAAELSELQLLAPCDASKVVCIGRNYHDHAVEFGEPLPKNPTIFIKPNTSINNPGGEIAYPSSSERVDYECEFAFVIKKKASHVKREDAADYILGYTCLNDVTARDVQASDGQWTRGKGYDTFCPIGPWVTDEFDPAKGMQIETRLNGVVKQHSTTDMLMWPVPELVEFITDCMTLLPGDVVTTGTPAGIGPMQRGDTVTVYVEGIGELTNSLEK